MFFPDRRLTAGPPHSLLGGPTGPLDGGGFLGWVQLQPLEQGGTGQQHHSGGDQRYPGGRSEQPASGAHVLTEDPRRYTAATNGLAKVIPGWDATSRPACRAFWRRRNPTGKVRISK